MSVRIHVLSKQLGMENKELIALLKERGHDVTSASSSIADIYAEDLVKEFAATAPAPSEQAPEQTQAKAPEGPIVKSAQQVKEDKEAAVKAATTAAPTPPPAPAAMAAPTPPPPAPAQAASMASKAPVVPAIKAAPTPPAPTPAPKPAPTPAPVVPAVKPAPVAAPVPPPNPAIVKAAPVAPVVKAPVVPSAMPTVKAAPVAAPTVKAPVAPSSPAAVKAPFVPPNPVAAAPVRAPATPTMPGAAPTAAAPAEGELRIISLKPPIVVREFAGELGLKPFRLISELMEMGIFASINQTIEEDVASKVAERHGFMLEVRHRRETQPEPKKVEKPKEEEPVNLEPRPAVVCIMGHVDHGKTTLMDAIRKANVAEGEAGGITQHIGAYQIVHNEHQITFLDTPGHAAFSNMRQRGTSVTDIAILVVAADDGFMPQTDEAMKFAQKANLPIIVAINKVDVKGANLDRVKQQMQQRGITSEDWGGETLCVPVAAIKGQGIPELLDAILLQAEMMELRANPKCAAEGIIIESQMEVGRGCTATAIIRKGTLKVGDSLVSGPNYCRVRTLTNDRGEKLKSVAPGCPVNIAGWDDAPGLGTTFTAIKNDREAKRMAEDAATALKRASVPVVEAKTTTVQDLLDAISSQKERVYNVVVKADVHGSAEALRGCLEEIKSDKIRLRVIGTSIGPITKNDIALASAGSAAIVGFNIRQENGVQALAKHHEIRLIQHEIIYELINQVKDDMASMLEPERVESKMGAAEVRATFTVQKGVVAGCMITEGRFTRDGVARLYRAGQMLHEARIATLKRFKDDVSEVRAGYECGVRVGGFNDYQIGDTIECIEVKLVTPAL